MADESAAVGTDTPTNFGAYTSASQGVAPDGDGSVGDDAIDDLTAAVAEVVAAETQHSPLLDDSLADLSWFDLLSILTAIEDELRVRIFADFTEPTVRQVLAPLATVPDIVELVSGLREPTVPATPR